MGENIDMIKQTLLIGAILFFTVQAFADDANNSDETLQIFSPARVYREGAEPNYISKYMDQEDHQIENVNDFYLRISGGWESDASKYSFNDNALQGHYDASGIFGAITLGYGRRVYNDVLYFGIAIDGERNSASVSFPTSINYLYDGSVSIPHSFGVYFIPGIYSTKTALFYLKGGIARAKYDISVPSETDYLIDSFSKNIFGYRAGGGVDLFFNQYFSFNIEYLFSRYNSFTRQFSFGGQTYDNKFEPHSNQISVGLACHI
jgi:opacity protein-like surface antigen